MNKKILLKNKKEPPGRKNYYVCKLNTLCCVCVKIQKRILLIKKIFL